MPEIGYALSEADRRKVQTMWDAYRAGKLGPPTRGRNVQPGLYSQPLSEVTSVDNGTCTVKRRYDADTLIADTETSGVHYDADNAPSVGDIGLLVRLGDGSLFFYSMPRIFDYTSITGYDAGKTQVLTHVTGTLTWVDTDTCA